MKAVKHTLIYYTCTCCGEAYTYNEEAERCCSGLSEHAQADLWERRLDLNHSSIPVCPHH